MRGHGADARGHRVFSAGEEHRHEAARDQVIQFLFRLRQVLRYLASRDDRKVIADFRIVENPLVRLHPLVLQDLLGELVIVVDFGHMVERLFDRVDIVFRQMARVGTWIRQHLVFFVQRLRQAQCVFCRKAEARIGFPLQAGQIKQCRRHLGRRLRFFGDRADPAAASGDDGLGGSLAPQAFRAFFRIRFVFLELGVEPTSFINAGCAHEFRAHFPIVARHEILDLFFSLNHDRQGWRLHAPDGGQVKAAFLRIERSHRACAVDADQPIRFAAAACSIGQRQHFTVFAQAHKAIANRGWRHRLQPQALDRLFGFRILRNQPENQFAFAPRVAGIDQLRDVLALDQLVQDFQARLGFRNRIQVKVRRNHRQMRERPFASLDVVFFRHGDFYQMADCGRQHVLVRFKVLIVLGKAAERLRDIVRDRGLLCDDESLGHNN